MFTKEYLEESFVPNESPKVIVGVKPDICDGCDRHARTGLVPIFPHSPYMFEAIWLCPLCMCIGDVIVPLGRWHVS